MLLCGRCFFFQAEDGIRDGHVTGVQTCALPIFGEVEVGQDIGGDDEDGFVALSHGELDCPRRSEVGRRSDIGHVHPPGAAVSEMAGDRVWEEVEEDSKVCEAMTLQEPHDVLHDGHIAHGHERLGEVGGEWPKAGPENSGHDDGFHIRLCEVIDWDAETPPRIPKYSGKSRKAELTGSADRFPRSAFAAA